MLFRVSVFVYPRTSTSILVTLLTCQNEVFSVNLFTKPWHMEGCLIQEHPPELVNTVINALVYVSSYATSIYKAGLEMFRFKKLQQLTRPLTEYWVDPAISITRHNRAWKRLIRKRTGPIAGHHLATCAYIYTYMCMYSRQQASTRMSRYRAGNTFSISFHSSLYSRFCCQFWKWNCYCV